MKRLPHFKHRIAQLALFGLSFGLTLLLGASVRAQQTSQAAPVDSVLLSFTPTGQLVLENNLIKTTLSNKTGLEQGLLSWLFKPTDTQQIDVLYGQTDYLKGHVFGEKWDPITKTGFVSSAPSVGSVFPATKIARSKDGSALLVQQVASDTSSFSRQVILRRDLTTLQINFNLTNLNARPYAASLRFHTVWSPASNQGRQNTHESIDMMTSQGPLSLDQSLTPFEYDARYKGANFFNDSWAKEPARSWVSGKQPTPALTGDWAVQRGEMAGGSAEQGMAMMIDPSALVGYYNSLGATLEPVTHAFALRQGESWQAQGYLASFAGLSDLKNKPIVNVTPLYVATEIIQGTNNQLQGKIVPLFQGALRGVDAKGQAFFTVNASPLHALTLSAKLPQGQWRLEAIDTQGKRIGVIDSQGNAQLDPIQFQDQTPGPPAVATLSGQIVAGKNIRPEVEAFLENRDFVVYCDFHADPALQAIARQIARKLGVGIIHTQPDTKALLLGDPTQSDIVRHVGQFNHDISAQWPGAGKGVILAYDHLPSTQKAAVLAAGSDVASSILAAKTFADAFLKNVKEPGGFTLWPATPADQIQPYTPAALAKPGPIHIQLARGAYAPAQMVLSAYADLHDINVIVSPLVNDQTGKPIQGKYLTTYRKNRAPLWLRWVRYYPLDRPDGWTGYPDPLTDYPVKDLPAGQSQALWLTVITPQDAQPGDYHASVTVKVGDQEQTIPVQVKIWDFTLPDTGIMGEPYMSLPAFPEDGRPELKPNLIKQLTENLIEHGMRIISLDGGGLVRWHFSAEGAFKDKALPWLTVSEDGKVAMDTGGMDRLIDEVDKDSKPFDITYRMSINELVGWPYDMGRFKQVLAHRFDDLPERKGHPYQGYYAQEMMTLLREHLVQRKMLDRFVLKIGDEPRSFQWWWDSFTLGAREARIPFATCLNTVSWPEVNQALGSTMKWIQPLYMHYDEAFFEKARKSGMGIGWYNCGPPPRNSVGTSAMELRSYIWQGAKADIDIIAWWGVQNWNYGGQHPVWYNRYSHWNSMIYPEHPDIKPWRADGWLHDTSPLDSLRWEHIRVGMEDAASVKLLREKIAQARKDKHVAAADQAQAKLDDIWKNVFPDLASYRPSWDQIQTARQQVAQAIVDLNTTNDLTRKDK